MNLWQRWLRQPQRVWLRRAAFQIHLWLGLAIGLYIVMLSLTGSLLVYRNELARWAQTPRPTFIQDQPGLPAEALRAAAERAYPDWTITQINERFSRRNPVVWMALERDGVTKERLFNPYTGDDLGDSTTRAELSVLWLARLHDELLLDRPGLFWNGVGSLIFTLVVLTGAIVWWPGITRWTRSLGVGLRSGWKRVIWDLHSAMGFWVFLFMLIWGVSGIYLGIPQPFSDFVDAISDPELEFGERTGDAVLLWLTRLHFGRWQSEPLKALWAAVGLVPALMFVTGGVMWWNRKIGQRSKVKGQRSGTRVAGQGTQVAGPGPQVAGPQVEGAGPRAEGAG